MEEYRLGFESDTSLVTRLKLFLLNGFTAIAEFALAISIASSSAATIAAAISIDDNLEVDLALLLLDSRRCCLDVRLEALGVDALDDVRRSCIAFILLVLTNDDLRLGAAGALENDSLSCRNVDPIPC